MMSAGNGSVRPGSRKWMEGAKFAMKRTEDSRAMRGGVSSRAVTAHASLRMAKSRVVVIQVTQFGTLKAMDIAEEFRAISNGVANAITVQTRTLAIVERAASILRSK